MWSQNYHQSINKIFCNKILSDLYLDESKICNVISKNKKKFFANEPMGQVADKIFFSMFLYIISKNSEISQRNYFWVFTVNLTLLLELQLKLKSKIQLDESNSNLSSNKIQLQICWILKFWTGLQFKIMSWT
jgi:hypothetical protein